MVMRVGFVQVELGGFWDETCWLPMSWGDDAYE